jgi:hypothetical protein
MKNVKIVNLTPHEINIIMPNVWDMKGIPNLQMNIDHGTGTVTITIPASGIIARCRTERKTVSNVDGIPVTSTIFGEVEGLPEPKEGTIYIVSSLVAQACKDRNDVFIPDDTVRDEEGKIIGCRSLGRI